MGRRLLEEFRECTFHPRRFTTDPLRGPEAQNVMQSLAELVQHQRELKQIILRCDEEEKSLDEYVKVRSWCPKQGSCPMISVYDSTLSIIYIDQA